jgi:hypothetical protein
MQLEVLKVVTRLTPCYLMHGNQHFPRIGFCTNLHGGRSSRIELVHKNGSRRQLVAEQAVVTFALKMGAASSSRREPHIDVWQVREHTVSQFAPITVVAGRPIPTLLGFF